MTLQINNRTADKVPSSVKQALAKLSPERQATWEEEYTRKARSNVLMLLLAILFPIQFFVEGRVGLGLLFMFSWGGFGLWYLAEIFMVWGRTTAYNEELAKSVLRDIKLAD